MFYRCKNCGGNVIYHPEKKKMICESCGSEESHQEIPQKVYHICSNCGGQIETTEYTLACQCPYCGTFHILEDRMEGKYKPQLLLPFCLDKHQAAEKLQEAFAGKMFLPSDFCSVSSLEKMQGIYVPFWMYDFKSHVRFEGEGEKIRTWREGDYECTETRIYRLVRDFTVNYKKIPVDASIEMEDGLMDLLEPYEYGELGEFQPQFLSGFRADVYEEDSDAMRSRAEEKADGFSEEYLSQENGEYAMVHPFLDQKENKSEGTFFAFLPVWKYRYRYNGKEYTFYVNGQTGKSVGTPPISWVKMIGMSAGVFVSVLFFLRMAAYFLEVL